MAKDWKNHALDAPKKVELERKEDIVSGNVIRSIVEEYHYAQGRILVSSEWKLYPDGTVDLFQTYEMKGELPELPRLGSAFMLNGKYENLSWYGRGPWENYPDRKTSCFVGRWNSTVGEQYTHYPRPQDSGNHEDVTEVVLTDKKGNGIRITALDKPFSFSALHYTAQDLYNTTHDCDLVPREDVVLSLDCAVMGLGNSSCGPGVLKKYTIDKQKKHTLYVRFSRISNK